MRRVPAAARACWLLLFLRFRPQPRPRNHLQGAEFDALAEPEVQLILQERVYRVHVGVHERERHDTLVETLRAVR